MAGATCSVETRILLVILSPAALGVRQVREQGAQVGAVAELVSVKSLRMMARGPAFPGCD